MGLEDESMGKFVERDANGEAMRGSNFRDGLVDAPRKSRMQTGVVILAGLILLTGVFYAGMKVVSNKEGAKSSQPVSQREDYPVATMTLSPDSQVAGSPNVDQKTPVVSPDKFGFTKTLELGAVGVRAKFPQNVKVSLGEENYYMISTSESDTITLALKNYSGGGRRAWFQKEYPWAASYAVEAFRGTGHSGYIAFATKPEEMPGVFFYFATVGSNKMLVVSGANLVSSNANPAQGRWGGFFSGDIDKFKSFLSTVELTGFKRVELEAYPQFSDIYRGSDSRKTVWADADLGLKITSPEWAESRHARERDASGKWIYTDWTRVYPEARTYDSSYFSEEIKRVEVTGASMIPQNLSVLSLKHQGKSFSEIAEELLIPAEFCAAEWKSSKSECASPDYCYTRDEVVQNLVVKKQVKIGTLDAQLRNLNQEFSGRNDCRSVDTWLIKARNGQFVMTNIALDSETNRVEAL